jgi:hypothetical protein
VHNHSTVYNKILNTIVQAIKHSDIEKATALLKKHRTLLSSTDEISLNVRAGVLYHAIQYSCASLVAFTLSVAPSPDIHFYRLYGYTPIALAIEKNAKEMLPILYPKSNKNFALHAALESKQTHIVSALRDHCSFSSRLLKHLGLT